ncbi:putative neutral metalloprotease [Treponema primitia ZAS-2]|uniref:Putative neutral metalloprotease n=1 Tax=Treponema primitia (strain ATCC BAA-887 / DSM 12427 / ZAS-2) TaxID=545694 RepID=F5YNC1_TREPZ|nr:neutral metalloprotease [Treponema primitia]AEF86506.1 putative neutral metalloprotease [Treponema primitia ZAS-2]
MRNSSKWGRTLLLFIILAAAGSCNVFNPSPLIENPGDPWYYDRAFIAHNFETKSAYTMYGLHLAENDRCIIYGENSWARQISPYMKQRIQEVAQEYSEKIYPRVTEAFGEPLDIDQNNKLIIILLDIIDGIPPGTDSYIAGYFYATDMGNSTNSNKGEIIYMDISPGFPGTQPFNATIAHELQHLLRYSAEYRQKTRGTPLWLNEGLSTAAEYIYLEEYLDDSIWFYNEDPQGTIAEGNNFFYWESTDLADYSTAYLFFQWLRIQTPPTEDDPKGFRIYKKICEYLDATSPDDNSPGTAAVVRAAKELIDKDLDSWEKLLRAWLTANYLQVADKTAPLGLYGYNNEFEDLAFHPYSGNEKIKWLLPGEGVFSTLPAGGFTPGDSGKHIRYALLREGQAPDYNPELKTYSGNFLLTYNAGDADGEAEAAYVTGIPAPKQKTTTPRTIRIGAPRRIDGTSLLPPWK